MCVIGNVFANNIGHFTDHAGYFFKQCDLQEPTEFILPAVKKSAKGILYACMTRKKADGTEPAWAGFNQHGVTFVAADAYLDKNLPAVASAGDSVFAMYERLVTGYSSAEEAAKEAVRFYREDFYGPDILIVGDFNNSFYIEANRHQTVCLHTTKGHFASANHFRGLYGMAPFEQNHSTYLRLSRTEAILQSQPDYEGIGNVLRDQYYGESVWSILRSNKITVPEEAPYYTQASVLFSLINATKASSGALRCEFVIYDFGKSHKRVCYAWEPFVGGEMREIRDIGVKENWPVL